MKVTHAGCLCGQVRVVAEGDPRRVGLCHCRDCCKHHGAVFHASAVFLVAAVIVTGRVRVYNGRHFCPRCGSSVYSRSGDEIDLMLGAMDDPQAFEPTYELWVQRRAHWLPPFPGVRPYWRDGPLHPVGDGGSP
jgi:hypothetical protein